MTPSSGSIKSPVPDKQEHRRLVDDDQHRLEPAQRAIGAPVLRELDRRALEVAAILLELRFEAREQRKRIGRRPGEARKNLVVVQPPDFLRALLDDRIAEGYLAVTRQHGPVAVPQGKNRRGMDHYFAVYPRAEEGSTDASAPCQPQIQRDARCHDQKAGARRRGAAVDGIDDDQEARDNEDRRRNGIADRAEWARSGGLAPAQHEQRQSPRCPRTARWQSRCSWSAHRRCPVSTSSWPRSPGR